MAETTASSKAPPFHFRLVTPEGVQADESVRSLVLPGEDGRFGVLYNHAPMVAGLVPGLVEVEDAIGVRSKWVVAGGFLEVVANEVVLLADAAERPEEIDVERAQKALERARERLKRRGDPRIDYARAEAALRRAIARLKAARGP